MIRTFITAASSIALLTGAAMAQDAMSEQPAGDPSAATTQELPVGTPQYTEESLPIEESAPQASLVTTKDDARAFGEAEFKIADADANGTVDQAEFIAYANTSLAADTSVDTAMAEGDVTAQADAATPEETFAELSEGQEEITQDKMVEARVAAFDEADANKDEKLDDAEKQQFAALVSGRAAS